MWFRADGGGIMTIILCSPLAYTDLVTEPKWQTAQAARDNRVCESADAPESFKTDVWKHFAVKKWEKLTGRRKTVCRRCRTKTNTSRWHFFFFFSTNCNVQSLIINKCWINIAPWTYYCTLFDIVTSSIYRVVSHRKQLFNPTLRLLSTSRGQVCLVE